MKKYVFIIVAMIVIALGLLFYLIFQNRNTSQPGCSEAINQVLKKQEVTTYLENNPNAKVSCDSKQEEGDWLIHVYEIVPEEGDFPSHTATFDWYLVKPSGEVEKAM